MSQASRASRIDSFSPAAADQGPIRIQALRHDDHSIDVKSFLELASQSGPVDINVSVFMPPSAQLSSMDKSKIMADFFSRGRLFMSGAEALRPDDLKSFEDKIIEFLHREPEVRSDDLTQQIRLYGATLAEVIQGHGERQRRTMLLSHSLLSQVTDLSRLIAELEEEIRRTYRIPDRLRQKFDQVPRLPNGPISVLEHYMHHLYVDYLGSLQDTLEKLQEIRTEQRFGRGWQSLHRVLAECRAAEVERSRSYMDPAMMNSRQTQELTVLRYSHMKKFFQSTGFVDVVRKESIRRLNEPIAAFGAAFAALAAASIEQMGTPMAMKVGFQGIAVMTMGVALYTVKDRLKDFIRKVVLQKVARFVPDIEQDLFNGRKKLGTVKEWFSKKSSHDMPESLQKLRQMACISEPEKFLQEDVLLYRKQIRFDDLTADTGLFFQDHLRINFERYLKYFDDHEKTFRYLDQKGNLSLVRSHRVYHFHMAVEVVPHGASPLTKFFRIVMDKNGIDRIEALV